MPAAPNVAQSETVHRSVRLRLLPGSRATAYRLAGTAGACRRVWNYFLDRTQQEYAAYQSGARADAPGLTFFSLGKEFTALRQDPEYAWLQEYSFKAVRHALKYLADAYQAFFQGQRARPTFKRKHARRDGFTIPDDVQVRNQQLRVPRIGWLRLKGSNLYAQGQPVQARIRQEGTRPGPSGMPTLPMQCLQTRCGPARPPGCWVWTAMWDR